MCGRFVAITDPDGLARFLVVDDRETDVLPPSYNVAPTDEVYAAVVRDGRRILATLRWGLVPFWADDPRSGSRRINARSESAANTPAFRDAFARHRCLVPADGFYEWRTGPGGTKVPHFITAADGGLLAFAGLWDSWRGDGRDAPLRTCTILTTAANRRVAELHDRMPVVLPPAAWEEWLDHDHPDPRALRHLLVPAPDDALAFRPVSQEANSPRNNHPGLLDPVEEQPRLL